MRGLYIVTPDWDETHRLLQVTQRALEGGATMVQYRHKNASAALRLEQAKRLWILCHAYERALIINDDVDLCLAAGADGVHVGATDASVAQARKALGPEKIVGASCYGELQRARDACDAGASYVALGGFYPSRVKEYPVTTPLDLIGQLKAQIALPVVVIGGMTPANAAPLIAQGADMVAAISGVYMASDPEVAAREFSALFN